MISIPDLWLPIVVSAAFVFVLSSVLHMVLTYHRADYRKLPMEDETMEAIRRAASVRMGIASSLDAAAKITSVPKVAIVCPPREAVTLTGRILAPADADIGIRMISVGLPHRAVPITGAICLAVAARIPGSIPHALCTSTEGLIRVGHASGSTTVDAEVVNGPDSGPKALYGAVFRSARRLFEGDVLVRLP